MSFEFINAICDLIALFFVFQLRYVDVQIIRGAGHHVYADSPTSFNEVVHTIVNEQEKLSQSNEHSEAQSAEEAAS
ncbi:unnamed protein product [Cylicocyclus nassatus]|uniref:Uncharacterized protein n=1 Tax=Cylicocyclus nassatus TaxID=53992 RepID=A0AA36GQM0_CYLNA|nr:unnamed protein product [Cylicocyclus nassatus]